MASKKIYIDATVLYSFIDRADVNHTISVKIIEQLSLQGTLLFTSVQAIQDTYSTISHQLGTTISQEFLQAMLESNIEIIYPQKADLNSAFKLIKFNPNKQVTLKESIIATIMQKRGITQILIFTYWNNLLGSVSYLSRT